MSKPIESLLYLYLKGRKSFDNRDARVTDLRPGDIKNILVVSCTAIGDTLLSTPAIRAVRNAYPKARIIALFNTANIALFSNNPNIDVSIPYSGAWGDFFHTVRVLRKYSIDVALIFHGNEPQATPLCYLSGARFIMKLPNKANRFRFLLSNQEPLIGWDGLGHGIDARLRTAALALCKADGPDAMRMELYLGASDDEKAAGFLAGLGAPRGSLLIGFQPGASTVSRQWFAPRFIELGSRLLRSYPGSKIVLTGSAAERKLCEDIAGGLPAGGSIVAAGKLTLPQSAALIKRFSALVTGDTGPMHMAIALGTPVVALYAVADPAKTGPVYDSHMHRVIKKPRTCDPCVSKKCAYQKCMEAITVDEVEAALAGILRKDKVRQDWCDR